MLRDDDIQLHIDVWYSITVPEVWCVLCEILIYILLLLLLCCVQYHIILDHFRVARGDCV